MGPIPVLVGAFALGNFEDSPWASPVGESLNRDGLLDFFDAVFGKVGFRNLLDTTLKVLTLTMGAPFVVVCSFLGTDFSWKKLLFAIRVSGPPSMFYP